MIIIGIDYLATYGLRGIWLDIFGWRQAG